MRILIVHGDNRPPGSGGGAESLLRDQAIALKALGHEVSWWYGNGSIEEAINTFKPDVCHLMTLHCYPMGIAPALYIQEQGIPHIWHIQDYWPFCQPRMLLVDSDKSCSAVKGVCDNSCGGKEENYLEIVNRSFVVAGNRFTAEIYRRNGLRCDAVVELGIDTDLFKPDLTRRNGNLSFYTATAWPEQPVKGMHILKKAIADMGIEVKLITGQTRENVATALQQADVFIFPSCYEETFGLCLCEAMASGCACIASNVAGARAQIDDRVTGLLVPPRDPEALRMAIEYMINNKSHRESMGQVAYAHVQKDHSLEAMGKRWEAVYLEVLNG